MGVGFTDVTKCHMMLLGSCLIFNLFIGLGLVWDNNSFTYQSHYQDRKNSFQLYGDHLPS